MVAQQMPSTSKTKGTILKNMRAVKSDD